MSASGLQHPQLSDGLAAVTWANDPNYHQFDNINVAAVPEPETYAMLLVGLGLLGLAARRRRDAGA